MSVIKKILLITSTLCSVILNAQTEQCLGLLITTSNGVFIGYSLNKFPVLSFESEMLNVTSEGLKNSYPWKEIKSLSYVNESELPSIINNLHGGNDYSVVFYDEGFSVSSNKAEVIKVYDVNGKCVYSTKVGINDSIYINYSCFTSGLYILSNGITNTKFFVK